MADQPAISIEQWRAFVAVVDEGGYAQAAAALHKSQSSVTYSIQKLESLLGVDVLEVKGRKAALTATGKLLYARARALLEEALSLEHAAKKLSAGWEAELRVAVEVLFPTWLLLASLERFGRESPHTRIQLFETVIDGTPQLLRERQVDFALTPRLPAGIIGEPLLDMEFVMAAHPRHALHELGRPLTANDLRKHRRLQVRDTSTKPVKSVSRAASGPRWTLSNMSTSIEAAKLGYGFAYYPRDKIRDELASGALKPLPLRDGGGLRQTLYLAFADRDSAGPGALRLAEIIRQETHTRCKSARER